MKPNDLSELLPWYVNGTLAEEERAQVDAWLAQSPDARAELATLKAVHKQLHDQPVLPASDLGWARLKRDISATKPKRQWWQPALAAAAGLVVCLQVVILAQPAPEPTMTLLSAGSSAVAQEGWLVQLEIDDAISWGELAAALSGLNARLVDGPGSAGLVRVFVSKADSRFASREAVETQFSQLPGITHSAVEAEY